MKNAIAQMSDAEKKELRTVAAKLMLLVLTVCLSHFAIQQLEITSDSKLLLNFDLALVALVYPMFIIWSIYAAYLERRIWIKYARVKGE